MPWKDCFTHLTRKGSRLEGLGEAGGYEKLGNPRKA